MASADQDDDHPQGGASRKWQTDVVAVRRAAVNVAEAAARMRQDAARMREKAIQMRRTALDMRARAAELRAAAAELRARRANQQETANAERRIVREERDFAARLRLIAGVGQDRTHDHGYLNDSPRQLNGNRHQATGDERER